MNVHTKFWNFLRANGVIRTTKVTLSKAVLSLKNYRRKDKYINNDKIIKRTSPKIYIFAQNPYTKDDNISSVLAKAINSMGYSVRYIYVEGEEKKKQYIPCEMYVKARNETITPNKEDLFIFTTSDEEMGIYLKEAKDKETKTVYIKADENSLKDVDYTVDISNKNYTDTQDSWLKSIYSDETVDTNVKLQLKLEDKGYKIAEEIIKLTNFNNLNEQPKYSLSLIILNYNNDKFIIRCIDSLIRYNTRYNYEIVIVDNQSTDGSYEKISEKYSKYNNIKIIRNTKNGCSSGRNLGVKNSTGEYILFLDSDQWAMNDFFLDNYLKIIKEDTIGAVGWGAGWFDNEGYAFDRVVKYVNRAIPPNAMYRTDIGHLETCGFIIKKELFEKIGGFDEYYDPTCYEDTDLSVSVRNAGFEIAYCPYLGVGHLPHQTTKSATYKFFKIMKRNGDYFKSKWKKINPSVLKYKSNV